MSKFLVCRSCQLEANNYNRGSQMLNPSRIMNRIQILKLGTHRIPRIIFFREDV